MSMRNRRRWFVRSGLGSMGLGASAVAAIALGAGLPAAMAAGAVGGAGGFFLALVVPRRVRRPDARAEIEAVLQDIDAQIEALSWLQIRLPAASSGKAILLRTFDAARAVAGRLHQGNAILG